MNWFFFESCIVIIATMSANEVNNMEESLKQRYID